MQTANKSGKTFLLVIKIMSRLLLFVPKYHFVLVWSSIEIIARNNPWQWKQKEKFRRRSWCLDRGMC